MTNNGVNGREMLTADQVHDLTGVPVSSPHDPYLSSDRLTLRQASEYLNIPVNTLRWYRTCGTGPRSYSLGGKVFYDRADLNAWVATEKATTARGG